MAVREGGAKAELELDGAAEAGRDGAGTEAVDAARVDREVMGEVAAFEGEGLCGGGAGEARGGSVAIEIRQGEGGRGGFDEVIRVGLEAFEFHQVDPGAEVVLRDAREMEADAA